MEKQVRILARLKNGERWGLNEAYFYRIGIGIKSVPSSGMNLPSLVRTVLAGFYVSGYETFTKFNNAMLNTFIKPSRAAQAIPYRERAIIQDLEVALR